MHRRAECGLLLAQAARQMGVSVEAFKGWERGRTPPDPIWPAIVGFLGYDPSPRAETFGQQLAAARRSRGLSVKAFAADVRCHREAIGSWERDLTRPTGAHAQRLASYLASGDPIDAGLVSELLALARLPSWPTVNLPASPPALSRSARNRPG